jgi:hypothetical protein
MNFRIMEKREWWLWFAAVLVTLLLTAGLASFLLPGSSGSENGQFSFILLPRIVGLIALVLIFDGYTLYQQLQIHRSEGRRYSGSSAKMLPT